MPGEPNDAESTLRQFFLGQAVNPPASSSSNTTFSLFEASSLLLATNPNPLFNRATANEQSDLKDPVILEASWCTGCGRMLPGSWGAWEWEFD